jgi:hypothetical protein
MMRAGFLLSIALAALSAAPRAGAAATNVAPAFAEVYKTIQDHLAGASEAEVNQAAVRALVSAFGTRVALLTNTSGASAAHPGALISRANLFDCQIAYLRIDHIEDGLPKALKDSLAKVAGTNTLKGLILDLRYARGASYPAAAATADLFIRKERPLLNWGAGAFQSKSKTDAIAQPTAILVNAQTAAAAEALAAILREAGSALLLGNRTAGEAMTAQEYPLSDGSRLRVATGPIQLGDGTPLSAQGLKPDISVEVSPQDELTYFLDAFKEASKTNLQANATNSTNRVARRFRYNEAELVRERKEGLNPDADPLPVREPEAESVPAVQDPALARALDVLKGLALVRQARS